MRGDSIIIRPAIAADADAYWRIEQTVYRGNLAENKETFLARLEAYPAGCKIAELDGTVAGYLLAHPWVLYSIPPLQLIPFNLPSDPDCFFIQNLALDINARGRGVARLLLQEAIKQAHEEGFAHIALVSVQDSRNFWERMGFDLILNEALRVKPAAYGPTATYMVKSFASPR